MERSTRTSLISFHDNVDVSAMINRGTRMQISRRVLVVAQLILLAPVDTTAAKLNSTARTAILRTATYTASFVSFHAKLLFGFLRSEPAEAPVPQPRRASVPREHLHNIRNVESIPTIPTRIILHRCGRSPPKLQIISFLDPRFCSALLVDITRVEATKIANGDSNDGNVETDNVGVDRYFQSRIVNNVTWISNFEILRILIRDFRIVSNESQILNCESRDPRIADCILDFWLLNTDSWIPNRRSTFL